MRPTGTVCSSCGEAVESLEAGCLTYDVVLAEVRRFRCRYTASGHLDLPGSWFFVAVQ